MRDVFYFFISFKFYTNTQPLINVGSFAFITYDPDFTVSDVLQKLKMPDGWMAKEMVAFPQEMHATDFDNFRVRHPHSVFDFREENNMVIKAELI